MRTGLFACLFLVACGSGGGTEMTGDDAPPDPDAGITPPVRGFQIVSPDIDIKAYEEVTYCYYFRTPNTEAFAIKKWESTMTPGSHHLILFTTGNEDKQPPGTVSGSVCPSFGGGLNPPSWTYSAQTAQSSMTLPSDDGTGKPLAMEIAPNTAGYIQMHYFNATDKPIKAHVTINAEALDAGVPFTKTAAYITYNSALKIDPGVTNCSGDCRAVQSCNAPANAKFWLMSTHAHKQAIKTEVLDGTDVVMSSNNWEHPIPQTWMSAPFYEFASGKVTWKCTYNNPSGRVIQAGDSAATDEMCMASGYYFPATKPMFCFNNLGPY